MKRIALYGGSFDPPHLGHVITITALLNSGLVDEIWLVPTGLRRDKIHHASVDDRKAMIAIMLSTMFGSRVRAYLDTSQINRSWQLSTTAELIAEMERQYPNHVFLFVIGSDLMGDILRVVPVGGVADQIRADEKQEKMGWIVAGQVSG